MGTGLSSNPFTSPYSNGPSHPQPIQQPTRPGHKFLSIPNNHPPFSNRHLGQRTSSFYKKPSDAELKEKIERGLCFRCDAKFSPRHRCKEKQLQVLLVHEKAVEQDKTKYHSSPDLQEGEMEEVVELSSNFIDGFSNPKTMKVKGKIA